MKLPPEEDREMPKKNYGTRICGLDLMKEKAPLQVKESRWGNAERSEREIFERERESPKEEWSPMSSGQTYPKPRFN